MSQADTLTIPTIHTAQMHTIQNKTCHFSPHIPGLGPTQALGQWVAGAQPPGIKRQGYDAYLSPPPGAGAKNVWSNISNLPHVFIVCCLLKHGDNIASILKSDLE